MKITIIENFKKLLKFLYQNLIPQYFKIKLSVLLDPLPTNKLRESTAIRTENYFQACKREFNRVSDANYTNHSLHKEFKKYTVRSNLITENWWSDFFYLIYLSEESKFQKINKSLIDKIENSNFNSLYHFEILDIYALCIRLCLFELAYHLREKSLSIALAYPVSFKKNESWKMKAKLSALLEIGNFSEFDKLLPLFKNIKSHERYFLTYLREVLENNKNFSTKNLILNNDSDNDEKFNKYIEKKKIAVVSPKLVNIKDGYKIDNADVVIRTNYKIGNTTFKGSKTDISYFNRETSQQIKEQGCIEWPLDLKWAVGRAQNYMDTIVKRISSDGFNVKNLNIRALKRVDNALFYGSLLMLPNIIIDLLRHNPKEIFLYHFDLLLSKDRIPGYFSDVNNSKQLHLKLIRNLPLHDPVVNFKILKLFWIKGLIKGDQDFENVMKMDIKDYMKNLQKNYRIDNCFEND